MYVILPYEELEGIYVSGLYLMIMEKAKLMYETDLKEISDIPFVFIRGVKEASDSFENADVMRGEETELMGIINPDYGKCVYILPGSHSKIIKTDAAGKICGF